MGMSANQNIGWFSLESLPHASCVSAWVASNMSHPDTHSLTFKSFIQWRVLSNGTVVNIAMHRTERFELFERVEDLECAEIARVPNFITVLERREDERIEKTVRVRNESNFHFRQI